jgi:hypothetical protein
MAAVMNRAFPALFALVALSCAEPDGFLPTSDPLYDEIEIAAARWASDPELPSIWTPRCARWLRDTRIWIATDAQWVGETSSAAFTFLGSGDPAIFLAPEPTADGYEAGVRHETAHILAVCTNMGGDIFGHETPAIWAPGGVVWGEP